MSIDYDMLTQQIMDGMKTTDGLNTNILKNEIGDSVLGRFLLYKKDPKNSIYHYYHHGWRTNGGAYVSYLCPTTNQESCPICERSKAMWRSQVPFLMDQSKKIRRKENYIVNFYVIENTKKPSENGKIKMFRFGKQIKTILDEAVDGEDKEIFGKNIWRFDDKGCNFRINVKPNSDAKDAWPSYTSSKFLPPSDLGLSEDEIMNIIDSAHDHVKIYDKQLSYEELTMELQKNFVDDFQKDQDNEDDYTLHGMKKSQEKSPEPQEQEDSLKTKTENVEDKSEKNMDNIEDLLNELETENDSVSQEKEKSSKSDIDDLIGEL